MGRDEEGQGEDLEKCRRGAPNARGSAEFQCYDKTGGRLTSSLAAGVARLATLERLSLVDPNTTEEAAASKEAIVDLLNIQQVHLHLEVVYAAP